MKSAKRLFEDFHERAGQSKNMGEYEFERALAEHNREIIELIDEMIKKIEEDYAGIDPMRSLIKQGKKDSLYLLRQNIQEAL